MHTRGSFHLVLVADGSKGTDAAARAVRNLIDLAAIERITVAAVRCPYDFMDDWAIGVLGLTGLVTQPMVDGLWKQAETWGAKEAERVVGLLGDVSIPVVTAVRLGNPVDELVALTTKDETDLVVIGNDECTKHRRVTRRDVAAELTKKAPCPVMIVRPEPEAPPVSGKRAKAPKCKVEQPVRAPLLAGLGA